MVIIKLIHKSLVKHHKVCIIITNQQQKAIHLPLREVIVLHQVVHLLEVLDHTVLVHHLGLTVVHLGLALHQEALAVHLVRHLLLGHLVVHQEVGRQW